MTTNTATDRDRSLEIAHTIMGQLGRKTLFMIGAKDFTSGGEFHLTFRCRGSSKVNVIQINLDPSDTYTVRFSRTRGVKFTVVSIHNDIYADQLHGLIERVTGLATRM
jgi:hypothetical protein